MRNPPSPGFKRLVPAFIALAALTRLSAAAFASDLGAAPSIAQDPGADIGGVYFFLDPNDNSRAILALTVHSFIVPDAAADFATFDPKVKFVFQIENSGDAVPDLKLRVNFDAPTAPGASQTAHIKGAGLNFTALTTPATLADTARPPMVTTDDSGVRFFAGVVDDPFFCDLVGVNRYAASARTGAPDPAVLQRGRDSFAGYNTLAITLSVPLRALQAAGANLGLEVLTKRQGQIPSKSGGYEGVGSFVTVDRFANPAVKALLIPTARQDEYNAAKPADDAAGKFAGDIAASLQTLGVKEPFASILNGTVRQGDYLRLDPTISNTGVGGGSNAAAGYPNGRRLTDDVIDTLLTFVANGSPLGDHVDASDAAPRDVFPFFAEPHQPLAGRAGMAAVN